MNKPRYHSWKDHPFFIKLLHWEYWPFAIVYFPVFFYYAWLCIRARALWFFSAANPGIETGGMLGETKTPILQMVPDEFKPKTIFPAAQSTLHEIKQMMADAGIEYPIIAKPDRGERGLLVERITSDEQLEAYIKKLSIPFIIQEFVTFKEEFAILYYILPGETIGRVASVTVKEFLKAKGDGKSTLEELILKNQRAILQWEKLVRKFGHRFKEVLAEGEELELEPIGNHVRGTKFLDGSYLIDEQLNQVFHRITSRLNGVYYCRYDLKCTSIEDLKQGKNIRIVEVNGVGAEPAHIYDPNYKILQAWKDIFRLWDAIFIIARHNHQQGVPYMTTKQVLNQWKLIRKYRKMQAA
ncbi:MAG: D-alanine--D-alanine ligase [Flavobacteriales bacterium]|nr:D-alanine--D-alanine ligase [Flavobacteriales bacterium]